MALKRMDNVLIVVDDLEAAKAFFLELGMELEGETNGSWVNAALLTARALLPPSAKPRLSAPAAGLA